MRYNQIYDMLEKKHWYDGWFYAIFIDTDYLKIRERLLAYIEPESSVIDIGCGTGSFALKLSKKCASVTGIDISKKMISHAKRRIERISFKY
jgi:ubiquinone/menaquinone biosynthesis C-methylase UbiE